MSLVSSKVTTTEITQTRENVLVLVEAIVDLASDDGNLRVLVYDRPQALRAGDQVNKHNSVLLHTVLLEHLNGLVG